MKQREELYRTSEYWLETIQNEIFREVYQYMSDNNLNKAGFAKKMGFSRAYITQVLNGEFNFSLKKLIELSMAINKAPKVDFEDIDKFITEKENELNNMKYGMRVSYDDSDLRDVNDLGLMREIA